MPTRMQPASSRAHQGGSGALPLLPLEPLFSDQRVTIATPFAAPAEVKGPMTSLAPPHSARCRVCMPYARRTRAHSEQSAPVVSAHAPALRPKTAAATCANARPSTCVECLVSPWRRRAVDLGLVGVRCVWDDFSSCYLTVVFVGFSV